MQMRYFDVCHANAPAIERGSAAHYKIRIQHVYNIYIILRHRPTGCSSCLGYCGLDFILRPRPTMVAARVLAIADLILYSAGNYAALPDMAFVEAKKFWKIYITLGCRSQYSLRTPQDTSSTSSF